MFDNPLFGIDLTRSPDIDYPEANKQVMKSNEKSVSRITKQTTSILKDINRSAINTDKVRRSDIYETAETIDVDINNKHDQDEKEGMQL